MALTHFKTGFSNIGNQDSLRPNFGFRYFFDIMKGVVFDSKESMQLKYVMQDLRSEKISKGDLEKEEFLLDIGNVERRYNNLINFERVNVVGSNKTLLEKGDLVIPKLQPQMGNIFLNSKHNKYLASTEFIEYQISSDFNPLFVYYLITHPLFLSNLDKLESGKTHRRVNPKDILKMKIPIVKLETQNSLVKKIIPIQKHIYDLKAKILDTKGIINTVFNEFFQFDFSSADLSRKEMIHNSSLSEMANEELKFDISLKYRNIFLKDVKANSNTKWIALDKLVDIKGGKRLPKGEDVTESETGYKYVRVDDLDWNGKFDIDNIKYITENNQFKIKKYIAEKDDILITIVGATVGKCGLFPVELHGANITENYARLIINKKEDFLPEYISYCLQSKACDIQIDEFKGRGSQGKLALFRIKKIKVPEIPIKLQQEIVDKIKTTLEKQSDIKKTIEKQRRKIDELYDNMLKRIN